MSDTIDNSKKYVSLTRLTKYDALIKDEIVKGDSEVTSHVDSEITKITNSYETKSDAAAKLTSAKSYTDEKIDAVNSAISTAKSSAISTAASDATAKANAALSSAEALIDALTEVVDGKADDSHDHNDIYYTETEINTKVDAINESIGKKQNKLTFDSVPTSNSTNPVTSDGVYTALNKKADADSYLPLAGGIVTGSITFDNSTTSQKSEPYLQWGTYSSNKPYIGFAHDQTDGTFIICSMEKDTTTNGVKYYRNGLAIGGGSGNLFWKGSKVATATDLDLKSNLASPTFTGTPKAPTASAGTNTTQIATTAFVTTAITNAIGNAIAASY